MPPFMAMTDIELVQYPPPTAESEWASLATYSIWEPNRPYVFRPIENYLRQAIIKCFIGGSKGNKNMNQLDSYFAAFKEGCERFKSKIEDAKLTFLFTNYAQLLNLAHHLKMKKTENRKSLYESFFKTYQPAIDCCKEEAYFMIDLCVLLWLRIDVTERVYPGETIAEEAIWSDDESLKQMIAEEFPLASYPDTNKGFFRKWFTLERLVYFGYFRIQWTNQLREHLLVDPFQPHGIRNIYIFHHASFLTQLAAAENNLDDDDKLFPTGFLQETVDSLKLLIPRGQSQSDKWYLAECERRKRAAGKFSLRYDNIFRPSGNSSNCAKVTLDREAGEKLYKAIGGKLHRYSFRERSRYSFWGGRLSAFEQVVDEAEPMRLKEWLRDPRTAAQSYGFWLTAVSVLVAIVLGIVQVALTGVQVQAIGTPNSCTCNSP